MDSEGLTCADYASKAYIPTGPQELNYCTNRGGRGIIRDDASLLARGNVGMSLVNSFENFGLVAQQACCACGGGVRRHEEEVTGGPFSYNDKATANKDGYTYEREYNVTCEKGHKVCRGGGEKKDPAPPPPSPPRPAPPRAFASHPGRLQTK